MIIRNGFLLVITACLCGCATTPSTSGTWTGHLIAVRALTREGKALRLAALQIESGPPIPFALVNNRSGWLPAPILSDSDGHAYVFLNMIPENRIEIFGEASQLWPILGSNGVCLSRMFGQRIVKSGAGRINVRSAVDPNRNPIKFQLVE